MPNTPKTDQEKIVALERENKALKKLNLQLSDALDHISDGFVLFDDEDQLVLSNAKYREIYKSFSDLAVPGTKFEDLIRTQIRRIDLSDAKGREEEWIKERVAEHRNPKGTKELWFENGRWVRRSEFKTPAGGIVGILTDITELKAREADLKENEQRLRASEGQLRTITNSVPVLINYVGADRRIQFVNRTTTNWYNLPASAILGRTVAELFGEDSYTKLEPNIDSVLAGGSVTFEDEFEYPDGKTRNVQVSYLPDFADDKSVRGFFGLVVDLTARRQAELGLKESEEKFKDFAESSADWFWEMDENLRFTYVSDRIREVMGIDPESYIGKSRDEFHNGDLEDRHWRDHAADLKARRPFRNFQIETVLPNGELAHFSISGLPVCDDHGEFLGYRGTGSDITAQVNAELLMREREAMLRSFIDNSPSVIVMKDLEGRFTFVNHAYAEARGGTPEDWIGKKAYASSPPDHAAAMSAQDHAVAEHRNPVTSERHTTLRDGTPYHRIVTKFPVSNDEDELIGIGTISTDVIEHYQTRLALESSEERLRSIIENSPSAIFLKGEDGRYQLVNKRFAAWAGRPPGEIIGKAAHEVFPKDLAEACENEDETVLKTQGNLEREFEMPNPDGPARRVNIHKFPVSGHDNKIVGVGMIGTDITERVATEEQLRQAQKMEAVGHLTGGVAHDFNNLLGVIIGNLDFLEERLDEDPDQHELIATALQAALQGAELTSRLLAFSRKQTLRPDIADLNSLIHGMTDLLKRTLGETISVRSIAAADLKAVEIDLGQLETALLNLAVNARFAMPDGGQLTIETTNIVFDQSYIAQNDDVAEGTYAMVAVSDTGTGMSPAILDQVFEPFFTTKEVGQGSGLGLSMVFGFVKQSGGHISIYSEEGEGTTVKLYFPTFEGEDVATAEMPKPETIPKGTGQCILVVEDDAGLRDLAIKAVLSLGYKVVSASDGAQALAILDEGAPIDLLFTDVVLPRGMNGVMLAKAALERQPSLRILYTSGYTENAIVHNGVIDDGIELLNKPYRRDELARRLSRILENE